MKKLLGLATGLSLSLAACGGSSGGTTGTSGGSGTGAGSTTGRVATSSGSAAGSSSGGSSAGATTSGTTAGAGATTTGGASSTGGGLADGAPCGSDAACVSGVCGRTDGNGHCCTTACATDGSSCAASDCDSSGACVYPSASCGAPTCASGTETQPTCVNGFCQGVQSGCPSGFACDLAGDACATTCATGADCQTGFFCEGDAGTCTAQLATGPCAQNEACVSGFCGVSGTGNCCAAACNPVGAPCGATGCDQAGACVFPDSTVLCGSVAGSCSGTIQQDPSACDGAGGCNQTPGTTDCTPFICGATACLSTCADNSSCISSDFCDVTNGACCSGLTLGGSGGTIAVDSVNGSDATPCCGLGKAGACQTIAQAMKMIDAAQATNVTINATVGGNGGDWSPKGEVYPIVLGWGVELNAPGVFFTDANGNNEIIDVNFYSSNDTVGYASIVGAAASPVSIGMDVLGDQSSDSASVQVEASNTLYLANAVVNGSSQAQTTAIVVTAGATLMLGEDQSTAVNGTVAVGGAGLTDGYRGIVCGSAGASTGCTIKDVPVPGGGSTLSVQGQDYSDIEAVDFAMVTLTASPSIGAAPPPPGGFQMCPTKSDASASNLTAVLLEGNATMVLQNASVQCISGDGFELLADDSGTPSLSLSNSVIQNTEFGIYAQAGTATLTSTKVQYNYNGVEQDTDGTNVAVVNLNAGDAGSNIVICSDVGESVFVGTGAVLSPGVTVLNDTDQPIDASNVAWDTDGPDQFKCDATLTACTCQISSCTDPAGFDGMDAVDISTGTVTTDNPINAGVVCQHPAVFCGPANPCQSWQMCCMNLGGKKSFCRDTTVCN